MKILIFPLILIVLLSSITYSQTRTTIAVMDLSAAGVAESDAQVITSRLRTDLFNTKKFVVLEREKVREILNEQGFQQSMCTTNECVVEIGKLLGVQLMVAGEIGKVGNLYTITIRSVDIESGKVVKTATEDCKCNIETVLTQSVKNVAEILAGNKIQTETYTTSQRQNYNFSESGLTEWEMKGMTKDEYIDFKASGLSKNQWDKYNDNKISAFSQSAKSLIMPGWGQLSMDRKRGYTYLIIEGVGLISVIYCASKESDLESKARQAWDREWYYIENGDYEKAIEYSDKAEIYEEDSNTWYEYFIISLIGMGVNHLVSSIDAGYTTPDYNKEMQKKYKLSFTPKLNKYSKQPMLGLNIEF